MTYAHHSQLKPHLTTNGEVPYPEPRGPSVTMSHESGEFPGHDDGIAFLRNRKSISAVRHLRQN